MNFIIRKEKSLKQQLETLAKSFANKLDER